MNAIHGMTAFYAQHLLGWITVLLFGAGVYLLSRQALDLILDLSTGFVGYVRRQWQPRVMRRLMTVIQEEPLRQAVQKQEGHPSTCLLLYSLSRLRIVWIAVGILAVLLLSDAMLSPLALTAILVGGELYRAQLYHQRMGRLNEDVGNLVVQFQSRYPLNRSLVKTLQEAANVLPGGETRSAVESTLTRLRMNMAIVEAVKPLQSLPHPVMRQLAGTISGLDELPGDMPVFVGSGRAPYHLFWDLSYFEYIRYCDGDSCDGANVPGRNSWRWNNGTSAWERYCNTSIPSGTPGNCTVYVPPTGTWRYTGDPHNQGGEILPSQVQGLPPSLAADLDGNGVPDAYWNNNLTLRRMDDYDRVGTSAWGRSWNWGGTIYWGVREGQAQIGWPGVP